MSTTQDNQAKISEAMARLKADLEMLIENSDKLNAQIRVLSIKLSVIEDYLNEPSE
jgi:hypothetical protein